MRAFRAITVLVFISLVASSGYCATTDNITVKASVSRYTVHVGDRIKLRIELRPSKGLLINIPESGDYMLGEFEIKDSRREESRSIFGGQGTSVIYEIASYEIGKHSIPSVEVRYKRTGSDGWDSKRTEPIEITVLSVLPKGVKIDDIKDIKGPVGPRSNHLGMVIIVIIIGLLATVAAILYIRNKSRIPKKTPYELAIDRLQSANAEFSKGADVKAYYVMLTDIVRRYIEGVFILRAPEMTTEEFLDSMERSSRMTSEQKGLLKGFLNASDLVKFARYRPTGNEKDSMYAAAARFVEETKDVHV